MDNDNLLVQKAADLYRGLRFKMKYRGVPILSAGAGNDLARDLLESGQPFLFGRCGATEMRTAADYLHNGGRPFADRARADIRNLSGVFPTDDAALELVLHDLGGGTIAFRIGLDGLDAKERRARHVSDRLGETFRVARLREVDDGDAAIVGGRLFWGLGGPGGPAE